MVVTSTAVALLLAKVAGGARAPRAMIEAAVAEYEALKGMVDKLAGPPAPTAAPKVAPAPAATPAKPAVDPAVAAAEAALAAAKAKAKAGGAKA
jgi:hypothetical protein